MTLAALLAPLALAAAPAPARIDGAALKRALDEVLGTGAMAGARVGACVLSLESGEVLYARDPDTLLNPASNVKLFTTAAALLRLGPSYRFETEIWAEGRTPSGAVRSLTVRGKGDPSIDGERLWALAGVIRHLGVRAITGDLRLDASWFDDEPDGPGFDQETGDRAYRAPAGALSLDGNTVAIHVGPGARPGEVGRVELEPASAYFQVVNRTATVKASGRGRVVAHTQPRGGLELVEVTGRIPAASRQLTVSRRIDDPDRYFGETLRRMLELRGVRVGGKVVGGPVPAEAQLLHVFESEPLAALVRRLNKTSSNFMAEQVLKTLGAEGLGAPGSWEKGIAVGEEALAELGLPRGSYVWKNGSGLNDTNRFSARQTAQLLREVWRRFPLASEFVGSLPVAGRDGTVRYRMEGTAAEGRLRAKTGSQEGVSGLSGYVESGSGELLAFAILANDFPGRVRAVARAVDSAGALLAEAGGAGGRAGLASAPATGSEGARVATYRALGRAADRRNARFLRGAVRAEHDPLVRLAAAEALYRSDPDSEAARRAFLDAVPTDGPSLARLRELWGEGGGAAAVMDALADLASEGLAEALVRFLELAPAAGADPALSSGYAEAIAEVTRNAPEEAVAALRALPAPAADAALTALAPALGRGGSEGHPFPASLRLAAEEPDEARAAPARDLLRRLDEVIAASRGRLAPAGGGAGEAVRGG